MLPVTQDNRHQKSLYLYLLFNLCGHVKPKILPFSVNKNATEPPEWL